MLILLIKFFIMVFEDTLVMGQFTSIEKIIFTDIPNLNKFVAAELAISIPMTTEHARIVAGSA